MTEFEIIQVLGQLLDDRLEHVAKKTDIVSISAEIKATETSLAEHLAQHQKKKVFTNKIQILVAGCAVTGIVSAGVNWLF